MGALGEQLGELGVLIAESMEGADWGEFSELVSETVEQAVEGAQEAGVDR